MRANLVTAAVEGCLLGFRSGYAGTCRAKHDAKASSQVRVFLIGQERCVQEATECHREQGTGVQ